MKKMFIIGGGLGLLSFVAGLAGLYLLMPSVDPVRVEDTKLQLDSLGLITYRAADSIRAVRDSLHASDSLAAVGDSAALAEIAPGLSAAGAVDSLQRVIERIRRMEQEKSALLTEVESLTARLQTLEERRVEAENLSATLAKVEDRQLGAILQSLDARALELIYLMSSSRNQARLLQALPPDRAASFIRSLVKLPPGAPPAQPAATPTAANIPQEGTSEP